jgi:hypothetical protein
MPTPFIAPPPNREPIGRLCFHGPHPKVDYSVTQLIHDIGTAPLPNAVVFPDTNVFTKEMDPAIWDSLRTKQVFIGPSVWKELLPWIKSPFHNRSIRDDVLAAVREQIRIGKGSPDCPESLSRGAPRIEVLFAKDFTDFGYEYYVSLLSVRKAMGTLAFSALKKLGRNPTGDELLAKVQRELGARGFSIAKKGMEAMDSPNWWTDQQLALIAIITAIARGAETFVITHDPDVLEHYFKALCHIKEHYRGMLVAKRFAETPSEIPFREVPNKSDGRHVQEFCSDPILQYETTDKEFNPLPANFHPVNIYCLLLGGKPPKMRVTFSCFCAETEMEELLRIKTRTNGLNTDRLEGRNCSIRTTPLLPDNHRVTVSIGMDTIIRFGPIGNFRFGDFNNTLFENEQVTELIYK